MRAILVGLILGVAITGGTFARAGRVCHHPRHGTIMCVASCSACTGLGEGFKCLKDKCLLEPDWSRCPKPDRHGVIRCEGKIFYLR